MLVTLCLESINIIFMLTNESISDIVKDFTALLIVSDFDDYFYLTVRASIFGKLISDGAVMLGDTKLQFEGLAKIETTTSDRAPSNLKLDELLQTDDDKNDQAQD